MQHLEDFRKLYFHVWEYIGMKPGFRGGKNTHLCVYWDIHTHGVCRNIQAGEAANY